MPDQVTVVTSEAPISVVERIESIIVVGAEQGPPGPPGAPGIGGIDQVTKLAGANLGGNRAVVHSTTGSTVVYADNTNALHEACVLGITAGSALVGEVVQVQTSGEMVEPTWTWTPREAIYLTTNGQLTQTPPTSGFVLQLGFALTATSMFVSIKQAITLEV